MIFVTTLPNDRHLRTRLAELRAEAKTKGYRVRTYGRCHDKVAAFKETGRPHRMGSNANSIYSVDSPEAKFCYEWKVYRTETKEEKAERERLYVENLKRDYPDIYEKYYANKEG